MTRAKKNFKDRDYLITPERLYFCVVGYIHPPYRVTAYLKYAPEGGSYQRVLPFYTMFHLQQTLNYLDKSYPHYLFYDPVNRQRFSSVPFAQVKRHFCPEEKLRKMFSFGAQDRLEQKALDLSALLSEWSCVSLRALGVTGSILIGLHNPKLSDIDLTVYGMESSFKLKSALLSLFQEKGTGVERFKGARLKAWHEAKVKLYYFTSAEAETLFRRTWNRGTYKGTMFSLHPTRLDKEVKERYGEVTVVSLSPIEAEARIENAEESIFLPAVYKISDVKVKSGPCFDDLREIVSYEGLYSGVFQEGEEVKVKGMLERLKDRHGRHSNRVTVGSLQGGGREYIKPSYNIK